MIACHPEGQTVPTDTSAQTDRQTDSQPLSLDPEGQTVPHTPLLRQTSRQTDRQADSQPEHLSISQDSKQAAS